MGTGHPLQSGAPNFKSQGPAGLVYLAFDYQGFISGPYFWATPNCTSAYDQQPWVLIILCGPMMQMQTADRATCFETKLRHPVWHQNSAVRMRYPPHENPILPENCSKLEGTRFCFFENAWSPQTMSHLQTWKNRFPADRNGFQSSQLRPQDSKVDLDWKGSVRMLRLTLLRP